MPPPPPPDVAVSVLGAPDTIQIQVGVATSVQELEVPEGGANTYSMVLSHQPSGDVTVTVNNPTDNSEVTATPRTLTFTTENWHAPQTVTVAAVHDGDAADDSATVTHGVADGGYNGVTVPDVAVTVDDDETVSIVLSKTTLTVDEEDADGETYTVKLSHEPSVEVTVTVTGQDETDLEITGLGEGNTLTFDATTWDDAQTVTVKAREDADAKNDSVTLTHAATGGEYEGVEADLPVTVDDDETVSVVLSKSSLTVVEGDTAGQTYTVKLSHEPSVEVTVTVSGQDETDLEITGLGEGNTLTFDATTWSVAQTVTVKAGAGRGRQERRGDPGTHRLGRRVRGSVLRSGRHVDDDETVSIVLSKTDPHGGGGGRHRRDLHGEAVPRAVGRGDGDGDRPGHDGPGAERSERDGHPDLYDLHLGRCADGDGEGQRGHRRQERQGHPGPHEYEGVEADLPVTVDDDETVSIVLSKTRPHGGGGGRRQADLHGEVPRAVGRDGDGDRPRHRRTWS